MPEDDCQLGGQLGSAGYYGAHRDERESDAIRYAGRRDVIKIGGCQEARTRR